MAEIEVEGEMLAEKSSFTQGCNAKAIQEDADYGVVPSIGEKTYCTEAQLDGCPFCSDLKLLDKRLRPIEEQLQLILRKADEYQNCLVYSKDYAENKSFSHVVPTFLKICEPYFNYLETTGRNTSPRQSTMPLYIRSQMLQLSQQLCSQLEQLILAYALYGHVSLAESDPMGVSHFYIGQCQMATIKVSIFRYCQPTPYLALTSNGLYKRMRWNLEHEKGTEPGEKEERNESTQVMEGELAAKRERRMEGNRTEYYFLCYENVHLVDGDVQTDRMAGKEAVQRMWSVGTWVPISPEPDTEDINDWLLCPIPQGQYKPLVYLGETEPSSCFATDCLLGVLLSQADKSITHPIIKQEEHVSQPGISTYFQ